MTGCFGQTVPRGHVKCLLCPLHPLPPPFKLYMCWVAASFSCLADDIFICRSDDLSILVSCLECVNRIVIIHIAMQPCATCNLANLLISYPWQSFPAQILLGIILLSYSIFQTLLLLCATFLPLFHLFTLISNFSGNYFSLALFNPLTAVQSDYV